jgi:hypothetical protein
MRSRRHLLLNLAASIAIPSIVQTALIVGGHLAGAALADVPEQPWILLLAPLVGFPFLARAFRFRRLQFRTVVITLIYLPVSLYMSLGVAMYASVLILGLLGKPIYL